jgi:hypothetical protein
MVNRHTRERPENPQLAAHLEALAAHAADVQSLAGGLTPDGWHWSPEPKEWSIAQCLDHINQVNGLVLPRLQQAVREARARGWERQGPFRYPLLDRLFIRTQGPETGVRMQAPRIYRPDQARSAGGEREVLARFHELQDGLMECLRDADGLDLRRSKIPSPVSGLLRVSLGAWFEALANHEANHIRQAQRVRNDRRGPWSI